MNNEETKKEEQQGTFGFGTLAFMFISGVLWGALGFPPLWSILTFLSQPEEVPVVDITQDNLGTFGPSTDDRLDSLEAKVNAIIDNLPEKERCRIQAKDMIFDVPDGNPHDGSVTFTTTPPKDYPCYKWLEKVPAVPERYKYP